MTKKIFLIFLGLVVAFSILGFSTRFSNDKKQSVSATSTPDIPDTPEAKEIMQTIERAYDIEAEAAYTFDFSKFPNVFVNDPRYPVAPQTLDDVKGFTHNPTLVSAGYLDYKIAYYTWRRDATLHQETIYATAQSEGRVLTEKERQSLVDSGRIAPARAESSTRKILINFISMKIDNDIALVVLDDGPRTIQLTLVFIKGQWYIADYVGLEIHP